MAHAPTRHHQWPIPVLTLKHSRTWSKHSLSTCTASVDGDLRILAAPVAAAVPAGATCDPASSSYCIVLAITLVALVAIAVLTMAVM